MEHGLNDRASDEVPFLTDEEKDVFATPIRAARRGKWAHFLPYSGILNIVLLIALLTTWALQRRDWNKPYIPNEIYCKQPCLIFIGQSSNMIEAPAQSAVEYETVVFTGGLRGDKGKFQGSSSDVDAAWDELYNRLCDL